MSSKDTPSAPAAPSPSSVSAANDQSALYNAGLQDVNQTSPLGSQTFTLDNSNPAAPTMSENTTYSPGEQQLLNTTVGNMNTEANTATNLQGQIAQNANTPINYAGMESQIPNQGSIAASQTADFNAQMAQLQPLLDQQTEQEQSQLANQGISTGSQAYNNGMYTVNASQNNARQQALSNAQAYGAQANSTALSDINAENSLATQQQTQPINEYSSLMGGTQVQAPSFSGAPSSSSPASSVPMAGNELEQQYSQQMQAYNAQVGSANSATQGLFGLGGSLGSAAILAGG